MTYYIADLSS